MYTIELDGDEGRGELFERGGRIWCRRLNDDKEWDTETQVTGSVEETILAVWGKSGQVWDLRMV